jgi:5-methyltetrahydropteroyltriglutamate--homocysteine methyltransferase
VAGDGRADDLVVPRRTRFYSGIHPVQEGRNDTMKRSENRIITTHVGSFPRPPELMEMMGAIGRGEAFDAKRRDELVKAAIIDVVVKQTSLGVDVVNDGEMGKPGFINYANQRLGGFEQAPTKTVSMWHGTRETRAFPEFYEAEMRTVDRRQRMRCVGPITYAGQTIIQEDIRLLKGALAGKSHLEAFVPSASPSLLANFQRNEFYKTEEEYLFAVADAMRDEYKAITDAGLLVQIDDPGLLSYHMRNPSLTMDEWRKWAAVQIEALNHALRGIPQEKVRHHTCHGINMGPRVHEMEFKDHIEMVLRINAGGYSFEAANPRHEHEWRVWEEFKLPDDKVIIPGVVTQSSVLVEHPILVADRIERFANIVGRERVIASTDCGFASSATSNEIHPTVVWAKIGAMVEGARIASQRLWKSRNVA